MVCKLTQGFTLGYFHFLPPGGMPAIPLHKFLRLPFRPKYFAR
jgi:hypothetical protein